MVAVLISFPPEPLYFPNVAHMDCAVRVWKKASQRRPVGMSEETLKDGRLKSARTTYKRLTLPGYRHSMPVQEALKETRWPDFYDGNWGNRENPPAPEGDVRPAPETGTVPAQRQVAAGTSRLVLDPRPATPGISSTKASSKDSLTSNTLRIVIPAGDPDTSEDEMGVSASPPRLPGSQGPAANLLTEAVTAAIIHQQQVEDEAAGSSPHSQGYRPAGQRSSQETSHQEPEGPVEADPMGARPRAGQKTITPMETHTWEEVESAVWQSAQGTADGAIGYALAILDKVRTDIEERFCFQTRALQDSRQEGKEFGRHPQLQSLLGRMRYLWERNIALQLQVRALTEEREEQIQYQAAELETTLGLHNKVAELTQARDQLQRQLNELRAAPPVPATPPAPAASEVQQTTREWKALADRLEGDVTCIRTERGKLRDQVKGLQTAYQQKLDELARANYTIDFFREQIKSLRRPAQPTSTPSRASITLSGSHLPTHEEMGGHIRLPVVSDPALLLTTTPEGQSMPPTLTPVRNYTPGPHGTATPTLPQLTSQASASVAAPPHQEPGREEEMDSEPQPGPESQQ